MIEHEAARTALRYVHLMETAALAGPVEGKDVEARVVYCHLAHKSLAGGPPPTHEKACRAARRAWPRGVPADVSRALGLPG